MALLMGGKVAKLKAGEEVSPDMRDLLRLLAKPVLPQEKSQRSVKLRSLCTRVVLDLEVSLNFLEEKLKEKHQLVVFESLQESTHPVLSPVDSTLVGDSS